MNWNDITLAKFQQVEEVNGRALPDIDKVLFSICVLYGMTESELNEADPKNVVRMMAEVERAFLNQFTPALCDKIGRYFINYNIPTITLGQYIELAFFLKDPLKNAHYVLATMSKKWLRKHTAADHRKKADYFLGQPIAKIIGCVEQIKKNFEIFNAGYKNLFGLDRVVAGDAQDDEFNERYGWIYSATEVAKHEGIKLDDAFAISIIQAFNDLIFLKAKGRYEMEQSRKNKPLQNV